MFNVGAPVWGLDWCPGSQHVAVSTCASDPVMGSRTSTPGSIQIWSTDGECQVVLCLDSEVCALKWMPVGVSVSPPSYDVRLAPEQLYHHSAPHLDPRVSGSVLRTQVAVNLAPWKAVASASTYFSPRSYV